MANTNSILKIEQYLKNKDQASTPSQVSQSVNLKYSTVKQVLDLLNQMNKIVMLSNDKVTLVKYKNE